jgi:hypothetical protein
MISIDRPRANDQRLDFLVHVDRQIEPSWQVKSHRAQASKIAENIKQLNDLYM